LCLVHNLAMTGDKAVPWAAVAEDEIRAWIRAFTATLLEAGEMERLIELLQAEIIATNPLIGRDPELKAALDASSRAQIRAFVPYLVEGGEVLPPPEAFALARKIAARGGELPVLLQVYRIGQQTALRFLREIADDLDAPPEVVVRALIEVWSYSVDWFAYSVEQLIGAYGEERERWLRGALTRRVRTVERILEGTPVDVDEASTQLGHQLRRHQTALALWYVEAPLDPDPMTPLEIAAQRIAGMLGAPRPLVVPAGPDAASAWLATERPPDLPADLAGLELPTGVRVAVGSPALGLAGFRDSHRDALAARDLADVVPGPAIFHGDLAVVSLLSRDRDALAAFVARELGALGADDPAAARLRETVLAHFDGGVDAAAHRLGIHRNTVRYRLNQAEELLGRPLAERRRELEIALLCAAVYGTGRPSVS
jgi:hypothetical protein